MRNLSYLCNIFKQNITIQKLILKMPFLVFEKTIVTYFNFC